jgi:hypothetical protein
MNAGQSLIACSDAAFSVLLEPREEANDESFIDTLQTETFNGQVATLFTVYNKQLKSIPIRFDRVGADVALPRQING